MPTVYKRTEEHPIFRDPWDDDNPGANFMDAVVAPRRPTGTQVTGTRIIANDTVVAITTDGVKKTGVTKDGKVWSRWQNKNVKFYSMKRGQLSVYSKTKKAPNMGRGVLFRNITSGPFHMAPRNAEDYEALVKALASIGLDTDYKDFTQMIWQNAYPVLKQAPQWTPLPGLSKGLRQDDLHGLIAGTLGKTRYRKDVARSLASARSLYGLRIAQEMRRDVPVDWLVPALTGTADEPQNYQLHENTYPQLRHNLIRLTERQQRLLLADVPNARYNWIQDTVRQLNALPINAEIPRTGTWQELHDVLVPLHRTYSQYRTDEPIPQGRILAKLDRLKVDGMELRSAKTTHELINWGNEMSHCVGGYGSAAVSGRSMLFGLYEKDALIANLELDAMGNVRQFYGRFNQIPSDAVTAPVRLAIGKELRKKGKVA